MSFPDEETLVWAKKKFGGGAGGGATILKSNSHSAEPEMPVGFFDDNHAYYKLWDNTPSFSDLVGAVFGVSPVIDEIPEDELVDESTNGFILWQASSLSYAPMIVILEDLIENGVLVLSRGVYVVDNLCNGGMVVLAYNGGSGSSGGSSGGDSSGSGASEGPRAAMFHILYRDLYPSAEVDGITVYKISENVPSENEMRICTLSYVRTLVNDEGIPGEWITHYAQDLGFGSFKGDLTVSVADGGVSVYSPTDTGPMLLGFVEPTPVSETFTLEPGLWIAFPVKTEAAVFSYGLLYALQP